MIAGAHGKRPAERTFAESKATVEKALKQLQPSLSGHLPDARGLCAGWRIPAKPLPAGLLSVHGASKREATGGSAVRVSTKLTAWYADANASRSGYLMLTSNGRIEADVLDQLSDKLSSNSASETGRAHAKESLAISEPTTKPAQTDEPKISAPLPGAGTAGSFSSSLGQGIAASITSPPGRPSDVAPSRSSGKDLSAEIASLEDALKNQARPRNLVAVRKSGTPVVGSPSLTGKTLFLASAHDEFEMLDFTDDWVHVRISGLSRGWIWRTSLEMPEGIPDVPTERCVSAATAADMFLVSREETAQFPGDWGPLRGKNVKIISVQKTQENEQGSGASAKLEFAKSSSTKITSKWRSHRTCLAWC